MRPIRAALLSSLAALLALLAVLSLPAPSAQARDQPLTPAQFYKAVGVTGIRTRYVVLLDTGALDGSRLAETRDQLGTLLDAVAKPDDITVIVFDHRVRRTISPLGRADLGSLAMPGPGDDRIDLATALDAALTSLEDDRPARTALAVLGYGDPGGEEPSAKLRRRAGELAAHTALTVHAYPLAAGADTRARQSGFLESAFPGAVATAPWSPAVHPDLAQLADDVLRYAALAALAPDRAGRVIASWPRRAPRLSPWDEKAEVTLTLRSTLHRVPVHLSGVAFTVTDAPVPIKAKADTTELDLKPGATAHVTVELSWKADKYRLGRASVRLSGQLSVHARTGTPWAQNLAAIGLRTIPPRLNTASTGVAGTGSVGIPFWLLPTASGALLLLFAVPTGLYLRRWLRRNRPTMRGWLTAQYPEAADGAWAVRELGPVTLAGRRSLVTYALDPTGEGSVEIRPDRADDRGTVERLSIVCRKPGKDGHRDRGRCPVGGSVIINGVEFIHHKKQP
ncbi:hypothetical protein [Streptomyces sp. NPDC002676]